MINRHIERFESSKIQRLISLEPTLLVLPSEMIKESHYFSNKYDYNNDNQNLFIPDFSKGGDKYSGELAVNRENLGYWNTTRATKSLITGVNYQAATATITDDSIYGYLTYRDTANTYVSADEILRVEFYAKASWTTSILVHLSDGSGVDSNSETLIMTTSFQRFVVYLTPASLTSYIYFRSNDFAGSVGESFSVELTSVQKVTNGNHLFGYNIDSEAFCGADKSFIFDGVNDYLSIPSDQATDFNFGMGDFSICGRFKTGANIVSDQKIIVIGRAEPNYKMISITVYNSKLLCVFTPDGLWPAHFNESSISTLTINTNYFFAMTVDRSGDIKIYLNAVEEISGTGVNAGSFDSATYGLAIGNATTALSKYFSGNIYGIAVFNKALSLGEIKLLNGIL